MIRCRISILKSFLQRRKRRLKLIGKSRFFFMKRASVKLQLFRFWGEVLGDLFDFQQL